MIGYQRFGGLAEVDIAKLTAECSKVAYSSAATAHHSLAEIRVKNLDDGLRVYHCPHCELWHLGHSKRP